MIDFENTINYFLIQLTTTIKVDLEKLLSELNLHSGQIFVLFALWNTDGQSQIDLAKSLNLTAPTINKMIKSLESSGFVECRKCHSDGRLIRVFLTEKANNCRDAVLEIWRKMESQTFSNLTDTEKLVLGQLFEKIKENLVQNRKTDPALIYEIRRKN